MASRSSIFSASYVLNASISLPVVITVEDVADVSVNGKPKFFFQDKPEGVFDYSINDCFKISPVQS